MGDAIIGICRFSFLGKSDWTDTRAPGAGKPKALQQRAKAIYAEDRLQRRFQAFEVMCLPSIKTQTDPDFQIWLLTSPELPAAWMARLSDLCAEVPQIKIMVSELRRPSAALRLPLRQATAANGRPVVQFRFDDDDAFSRHHIARIRHHAKRFDDLPGFALSLPDGLTFGSLDGDEVRYFRTFQPFLGAGVAVRMPGRGDSVFMHTHFGLSRFLPALTVLDGLGFVQTRWEMGDTSGKTPNNRRSWQEITEAEFRDLLQEDFPFLDEADLGFAASKGAALTPPP